MAARLGFTVKGAAKAMRRSTRTIERWIHDGMEHRTLEGIIVIDREVLVAELTRRNRNNPTRTRRFETDQ